MEKKCFGILFMDSSSLKLPGSLFEGVCPQKSKEILPLLLRENSTDANAYFHVEGT
jgi:hypothetical protein